MEVTARHLAEKSVLMRVKSGMGGQARPLSISELTYYPCNKIVMESCYLRIAVSQMTSKLSGTKEQILILSPFLWTRNRDNLAGCSASPSLMGLHQVSAGAVASAEDPREAGRIQAHVGGCCTFSFSLPIAQRSPRFLSSQASPTWQFASSGHF